MSLIGFAVQAVFDTLTNTPMVCLALIVVVAWVDSATPISTSANRFRPFASVAAGRLGAAVALAATVAVTPTLARIDTAWAETLAGNDAFVVKDWPTALARYEAARAADPDFVLYQLQVASALARVGRIADARQLLKEAVAEDPVAVNQIGLARLELDLGDATVALLRARMAVATGTGEPSVALNAGIIGEISGDLSFALESFAHAISWDPALARAAFWTDMGRRVPKAEVVAQAMALSEPATAALIEAYSGKPADARASLMSQAPSHERDVYIAATWWLEGRSDIAMDLLDQMLSANPLDWEAAGWASRIARFAGDVTTANRYALWAYTVQADAAPSAVFELSSIPPEANDVTAGLPRSYPAGIYGRPTSPYLLMPTLVIVGGR
jgi:tetratricopeptide (TPR) repeat protein